VSDTLNTWLLAVHGTEATTAPPAAEIVAAIEALPPDLLMDMHCPRTSAGRSALGRPSKARFQLVRNCARNGKATRESETGRTCQGVFSDAFALALMRLERVEAAQAAWKKVEAAPNDPFVEFAPAQTYVVRRSGIRAETELSRRNRRCTVS
jgi:hypothetical protein